MITADLHSHTRYSHGASTPQEMYAAACTAGLKLLGFTEHSPRPLGFDYTNEYREQLSRFMPTYAREVCELRDNAAPDACQVLFGMEMDWLEGPAPPMISTICWAACISSVTGASTTRPRTGTSFRRKSANGTMCVTSRAGAR